MGLFNFRKKNTAGKVVTNQYKLVTDYANGFFGWNGNLYESDLIRSAIQVKAQTIGKSVAKHIRNDKNDGKEVNPDAYIAVLLSEPNPIMSGQMLQEKLITQLELNNNAFAVISRDANGLPTSIWPIVSNSFEALQDNQGNLYIRFYMRNGTIYTFSYNDLIHLRKDFSANDIFGMPIIRTLEPLMQVVTTIDEGMVAAIKNSAMIRWLLKFNQTLRPEDIKKNVDQFTTTYLKTANNDSLGVAGVDAKADAIQIEPKDYVPNEKQMNATVQRIYSLFHTNTNILQANYTENQWISYYESQIEPILRQLSEQYTLKLFTRTQRLQGNQIIFESSNLSYASMQTKLSLVQMVDRGIMSRNEVRGYFNLSPVDGGDEMLLRLDTAKVNDNSQSKGGEET
ncbi:MAG: phage portal protein [Liquorilactobacillus ghanensis]|uniref:phage portal protein n=1 Tax=Liquorilactobacillus ghanensis TaxID=399370 RepID=UPI0039E873FC